MPVPLRYLSHIDSFSLLIIQTISRNCLYWFIGTFFLVCDIFGQYHTGRSLAWWATSGFRASLCYNTYFETLQDTWPFFPLWSNDFVSTSCSSFANCTSRARVKKERVKNFLFRNYEEFSRKYVFTSRKYVFLIRLFFRSGATNSKVSGL